MMREALDATGGLLRMRSGDPAAAQALFQRIYDDLRGLAARQMRGQRPHHSLQPTALVHEVFLKLIDQERIRAADRAQFLALAAAAMRSVLVDHARRRAADKRGGGARRRPFDEVLDSFEARSGALVALDRALTSLAELNERHARIVELRFFGGMTHNDVAGLLGVSVRTVEREWRAARAWLKHELSEFSAGEADGS